MPPHQRQVNTVFQNYALFPFLTVFDNVAFSLKGHKLGKAELNNRVYKAIELVDADDALQITGPPVSA